MGWKVIKKLAETTGIEPALDVRQTPVLYHYTTSPINHIKKILSYIKLVGVKNMAELLLADPTFPYGLGFLVKNIIVT